MTSSSTRNTSLGRSSSVLAVITHYRYERWLAACIVAIATRLPGRGPAPTVA